MDSILAETVTRELVGPVYLETDTTQVFVEPLNTITAGAFLLINLIWLIRLHGRYRTRPFIMACQPLLLIGCIGGTVYHAFRGHAIWLLMDWIPIAVLTLAAAIYLWSKLFKHWYVALLIIPALFLFQTFNFRVIGEVFGRQVTILISYSTLALLVFVPMICVLIKTKWRHAILPFAATACFGAAILFRTTDKWWPELFPRGTHFLWHLFGAAAAYLLIDYVYRLPDVLAKLPEAPGQCRQ
jgi:hypothetical protein